LNAGVITLTRSSITLSSTVERFSFNRKVSFKTGRFCGKAYRKFKRFFSKKQTKVSVLATYWAIETFILISFLALGPTLLSTIAALFLYFYGTYALLGAAAIIAMAH